MICNCPSCQKPFDIQTAGRYSCDGCGTAFNAGSSPVTPAQPQAVTVNAMSTGDVKRICETMWTCTLWIIFTPIVLSLAAFLFVWLQTGYMRQAKFESQQAIQQMNQVTRGLR